MSAPTLMRLTASEVGPRLPALIALLQDVVDAGASVGFLPPLAEAEARTFWEACAAEVARGARCLWVAEAAGAVIGTVQLDLCQRANGRHRAEVVKLLVHTQQRRRGLARALMAAAEAEARTLGRTTLVLDTRAGDPSERLYQALGWTAVGAIPAYAQNGAGQLEPTVFYYKLL